MVFKNGVKSIQAAAYNGVRMVFTILKTGREWCSEWALEKCCIIIFNVNAVPRFEDPKYPTLDSGIVVDTTFINFGFFQAQQIFLSLILFVT